jgi:hypothetical protein
MKVKNIPKHAAYAYVAAALANTTMQLINLVPKTEAYLAWFAVFVFAIITLNWERNQFVAARMNLKLYLKIKWLDTLLDVLVANTVFIGVLYLLGWLSV